MKKNRGAQPNNKNALKHGLYSGAYRKGLAHSLQSMPGSAVMDQIDLLRVMNDRLFESLKANPEPLDYETRISASRAVALSMRAISRLLHLQALAQAETREDDELRDQIMKATEKYDSYLQ